jgi:hypothetical protein
MPQTRFYTRTMELSLETQARATHARIIPRTKVTATGMHNNRAGKTRMISTKRKTSAQHAKKALLLACCQDVTVVRLTAQSSGTLLGRTAQREAVDALEACDDSDDSSSSSTDGTSSVDGSGLVDGVVQRVDYHCAIFNGVPTRPADVFRAINTVLAPAFFALGGGQGGMVGIIARAATGRDNVARRSVATDAPEDVEALVLWIQAISTSVHRAPVGVTCQDGDLTLARNLLRHANTSIWGCFFTVILGTHLTSQWKALALGCMEPHPYDCTLPFRNKNGGGPRTILDLAHMAASHCT